jgi:hypothetical protein
LSGPKDTGSSSSRVKLRRRPSGPQTWTGVSPRANSRKRCRQAPQGVTEGIAGAHYQGGRDVPAARRDHGGDGARLGAGADRIGCVLHVAAGEDPPVRRRHRGTDGKARIGGIGIPARCTRRTEEVVEQAHPTVP